MTLVTQKRARSLRVRQLTVEQRDRANVEGLWAYAKRIAKLTAAGIAIEQARQDAKAARIRNRLVLDNINLARRGAHDLLGTCDLPYQDLENLAIIGLTKAIERFDSSKGKLSSFAMRYIKGEVQHYLRDHATLIKVPRRWREISSRAHTYNNRQFALTQTYPTLQQTADGIGVSVDLLQRALEAVENQKAYLMDRECEIEDATQPELAAAPAAQVIQDIDTTLAGLTDNRAQLLRQVYLQGSDRQQLCVQRQITLSELNAQVRAALEQVAAA